MVNALIEHERFVNTVSKEGEAFPELAVSTAKKFADVYLAEINKTAVKNEEHPLIWYIQHNNRFAPLSIPFNNQIIENLEQVDVRKGLFGNLNYEGRVEELVERPLDYTDDYDIGPYHWRRRTLEERFALPIHSLAYKLRSQKKREQKARNLSSFYLQTALRLYEAKDSFWHLAVADVLHNRGRRYGLRTIEFAWKNHARAKGYDPNGTYYPNDNFDFTPEYKSFTDPLDNALNWLNVLGTKAWAEFGKTNQPARLKNISKLISHDREEVFSQWQSDISAKSFTYEQVRAQLLGVIIEIGHQLAS